VRRTGVLSFGANAFGQLGRETQGSSDGVPALIHLDLFSHAEAPLLVSDVSCGDDHALASLSDGSVWVWGRGTQSALGLGAQAINITRPVALPARGDVKDVLHAKSAGWLCIAAGGNNSALLSCSPAFPPPVPVPQQRDCSVRPDRGGGGRWRDVAASELFTWGANKCGELGHRKRPLVKPRQVKSLPKLST